MGSLIPLFGSVLVLKYEMRKHRKERIEKSKPILIDGMYTNDDEKKFLPKYVFVSDGEKVLPTLKILLKNTDNGIAFIDKIQTENKAYFPQKNATIDKNTLFVIELGIVQGENLKEIELHCHDIYGKRYYYDIIFDNNRKQESNFILGDIHKIKNNI